jgi:DMSO/TMAO reductase YedYZ molybdopterin-dependent catalytic subunit
MIDGKPVGRRIILSLLALGTAGVVTGTAAQNELARLLKGIEEHDPTGLVGELPLGETFRYYSITGSVRRETTEDYRLAVSGLVARPATYTYADLAAMPQTSLVRDFQCVTGWRVPQVHWAGVVLSDLLDLAQPLPQATAIRFRSFDGEYTENMTLEQARRPDIIVALQMLGKPVTHDHGGPVRMYAAPMYGYKSTKWLSAIELTSTDEPGYWEQRGYPVDGFIQN